MARSFASLLVLFALLELRFTWAEEITFSEHVAPIIYDNCAVCHREDGVGPFPLIEYEAVKRRSRQISEVVSSRFMPPWKPDPEFGPKFKGERRLLEKEIEILNTWFATGSQPGNLDAAPSAPEFPDGWQLGEPDLVIEFPEPYVLQAEGSDVYRNFVVDVPIDSRRYVRAIEFRPSSQLAIHHALVQVDKSSTSRQRDEAEPGLGYDGMGIGAAAPPEGQLIGWTPGQAPYESVPGTAWRLDPGSDIVVQLHMLPIGKEQKVSPKIGLYFTSEPPIRESFVLQLREFDIEIEPGEKEYRVEESMRIPVDSEIVGLYPHAHYLGKELSAYAEFPDGSRHWLFRIPDWDFNWQGDYRYEEPFRIPGGSELHMVYVYDNSSSNIRNPSKPPERVLGGWGSKDEMAELSIQIMPIRSSDLAELEKAQLQYNVASAGGRSRYAYNIGNYFEMQGHLEKAGEYYFDAVKIDPSFASAQFKLGYVLERLGNSGGAEERYRTAIALQPQLIPANIGLARIHFLNRMDFVAIDTLKQVLVWEPENLESRLYLARVYQANGRLREAFDSLQNGLEYNSESLALRLEIGKINQLLGNSDLALESFAFVVGDQSGGVEIGDESQRQAMRSEAYYSMAEIYGELGDMQRQESSLDQAINAMPYNVAALVASALTGFANQDLDLAAKRLREISTLPENLRPTHDEMKNRLNAADWKSLVDAAYQFERVKSRGQE